MTISLRRGFDHASDPRWVVAKHAEFHCSMKAGDRLGVSTTAFERDPNEHANTDKGPGPARLDTLPLAWD
jgi:hypothetical protein